MNNLYNILSQNTSLFGILETISNFSSEKLYMGAGSIAQTVWNYKFNNELAFGITDIDIVYFNNSDLSKYSEQIIIDCLSNELIDIPYALDIKNQARVHLWYDQKFGYEILPASSIEDAIGRWPTTATSIAVRLDENKDLMIISPFGLEDLFSGTIIANKKQITKEIYDNKAAKWLKLWPQLIVIPW